MKRIDHISNAGAGTNRVMHETPPRFGDKRDVAAMLQMSTRSVDNLIADGCPVLKIGRRRCRFDLDEVREWLKQRYGQQRRDPVRQTQPDNATKEVVG